MQQGLQQLFSGKSYYTLIEISYLFFLLLIGTFGRMIVFDIHFHAKLLVSL